MNRKTVAFTALVLSATAALPSAAPAQTYSVVNKFDIGGTGRFDYLAVDGSSRVYVSRSSHVMVIDGATGKVLGDILDTPGVHGAAFSAKSNHGFTTNGGDSTVTMFDLKTLAVLQKIVTHMGGLDGIAYDDANDRIFTIDHGNPGSLVAIDAANGTVVGSVTLDGGAPEGGVSDGKGKMYINIEDKNEIQVVDAKTLKALATWPLTGCGGPGGLGIDRSSMRLFAACGDGNVAVVVDANSGKVVAQFPIGAGPDALAFDPSQKMIYVPGGSAGTVTVVHEDSPDKYTVIATVNTMRGARTIAVDPAKHLAYTFTPEYGPAPAPAAGTTPPAGGRRGRGPQGPQLGAWLFVIGH